MILCQTTGSIGIYAPRIEGDMIKGHFCLENKLIFDSMRRCFIMMHMPLYHLAKMNNSIIRLTRFINDNYQKINYIGLLRI